MTTFLGWIICLCLLPLVILAMVGAMVLLSYAVSVPVYGLWLACRRIAASGRRHRAQRIQ